MKRFLLVLSVMTVVLSAFAVSPVKVFEDLFDGRFIDNENVEQTMIKQRDNYFRKLDITDSPELVQQISKMMQKEAENGANYTDYQSKDIHYSTINYENNGCDITVYFRCDNGKDAYLFIQGDPKAFE